MCERYKINDSISIIAEDGNFTIDKNPSSFSPIEIDSSQILKAVVVQNGKVMGATPSDQKFVMHKAIGRNITYVNPRSKYYPADGPNTLTNGVIGTIAVGKYWLAFDGDDLITTINIGQQSSVQILRRRDKYSFMEWHVSSTL